MTNQEKWIEHEGDFCPVNVEQYVEVEGRLGHVLTTVAWLVQWNGVKRYRLAERPR